MCMIQKGFYSQHQALVSANIVIHIFCMLCACLILFVGPYTYLSSLPQSIFHTRRLVLGEWGLGGDHIQVDLYTTARNHSHPHAPLLTDTHASLFTLFWLPMHGASLCDTVRAPVTGVSWNNRGLSFPQLMTPHGSHGPTDQRWKSGIQPFNYGTIWVMYGHVLWSIVFSVNDIKCENKSPLVGSSDHQPWQVVICFARCKSPASSALPTFTLLESRWHSKRLVSPTSHFSKRSAGQDRWRCQSYQALDWIQWNGDIFIDWTVVLSAFVLGKFQNTRN